MSNDVAATRDKREPRFVHGQTVEFVAEAHGWVMVRKAFEQPYTMLLTEWLMFPDVETGKARYHEFKRAVFARDTTRRRRYAMNNKPPIWSANLTQRLLAEAPESMAFWEIMATALANERSRCAGIARGYPDSHLGRTHSNEAVAQNVSLFIAEKIEANE